MDGQTIVKKLILGGWKKHRPSLLLLALFLHLLGGYIVCHAVLNVLADYLRFDSTRALLYLRCSNIFPCMRRIDTNPLASRRSDISLIDSLHAGHHWL
jgi:hypothetical protein